MISRRNFVIIIIVMAIIFVLFQFSQVARNASNDYTHNEYQSLLVSPNKEWKGIDISVDDPEFKDFKTGEYILFLGNDDSEIGSVVSQWVHYSKRNMATADSLSKLSVVNRTLPEFLVIDSQYIDFDKDVDTLYELTKSGVSLVFCSLPDVSVIKGNQKLMDLFGIQYIKADSVDVEGMKLFASFLLGGEKIYRPEKKSEERRQDMNLSLPWYVTSGGTKTYMVGLLDDYYEDYAHKNEFFPSVIWRNSINNTKIFCVNGDYMKTTAGIGILSAMIYELSDYQLYPVVNAQNTLLVDFPLMSKENDAKINEIYSRSYDEFQSVIVWPTLISLEEKDKVKYTCLMAPKFNYSDPSEASHDEYLKYLSLLNEENAEIGLSLEHDKDTTLMEKLEYDTHFYDSLEQKYTPICAFLDLKDKDSLEEALKNPYFGKIRTIACAEDVSIPILSYITDDITLQSLTSNTENFTYTKDLMLKSVETVLGYDNAELNLSGVVWPEGSEDEWQNIYDDMSSALATFWKPFRVFDRTTLSESDQRVRTFLNIYSESERNGDTITLNISGRNDDTCYYILRTHAYKIASVEGATYEKIEEDSYLLKIDSDKVTINIESTLALK